MTVLVNPIVSCSAPVSEPAYNGVIDAWYFNDSLFPKLVFLVMSYVLVLLCCRPSIDGPYWSGLVTWVYMCAALELCRHHLMV